MSYVFGHGNWVHSYRAKLDGWPLFRSYFCLTFLKMAHPLTVKIKSAIYSLDTPVCPHWYWFYGWTNHEQNVQFCGLGRKRTFKHTSGEACLSALKRFLWSPSRLIWCHWWNVFVFWHVMWCSATPSHFPKVSHSLHFLNSFNSGFQNLWFKQTEAMWNLSESVHLVVQNSGLYLHNPSHLTLRVCTSCVHIIFSEESNRVSLKKKERGLAGHSAGRCLSIWNVWMLYRVMLKTIIRDDYDDDAFWCPWNQMVRHLITLHWFHVWQTLRVYFFCRRRDSEGFECPYWCRNTDFYTRVLQVSVKCCT